MCRFLFCHSWLDSVFSSGRRWEISRGLKKQKVKPDAEMDKLLRKHKGQEEQHSLLFWHHPGSPSSVVPCPLHVLMAKQLLSDSDILISSMPGRRTTFAVVNKCWWFYLNTRRMSVIEPKDGRRGCIWVRYKGGLNFWLISDFCNIMKGKHENGEEKQWSCSHIETPWAVESHGWCSHLNQM